MRICIVGHEYPPTVVSGPGRYATNLVNELKDRGHEITVIAPFVEDSKEYEKQDSVEVYRLDLFKVRGIGRVISKLIGSRVSFKLFRNHALIYLLNLKLRDFFRDFDIGNYDILHILDMHDSYFLNDEITEKVCVVISANDYYSLETSWNIFKFPYFCTDLPLRYLHYNISKVLNNRYLKKADRIISDTKYTANVINRRVGIPSEKIDVVYKGVDITKSWGEVKDGKYENHEILYVGSNMERKGVTDILKAMPEVLASFPDSRLTIIGKPSWLYRRQLAKIMKRHELKGHVEFIEYVPSEEIPGYYSRANTFVLTPVIEDLAQVLLEAMASRTPVVCTRVGANPEGIIDNETGILVEPREPEQIARAIIDIFSDPERAKELGENGRRRVERIFNARRMLEETLDVYNKLIQQKQGA